MASQVRMLANVFVLSHNIKGEKLGEGGSFHRHEFFIWFDTRDQITRF
jgi:hypothetical protein